MVPHEFFPWMAPAGKLGAGLGWTPSAIPGSVAGILKMTQWTQGCGLGASGSSTISASSRVSGGRPDHARGGERSSPSPVYRVGMTAPGPNAVLFRTDGMILLLARVIPGPFIECAGASRPTTRDGLLLHRNRSVWLP